MAGRRREKREVECGMMILRRREFLGSVTAALAALLSRGANAQQSRVPTIGVLVVQSPGSDQFWRGLRQALRVLGYNEGQNILFEYRSDQGEQERLPELAAALVRLKPDVIVTWFTPAAYAASHATSEIPIVTGSGGPESGLVTNFRHPGGNFTGISSMGAELDGKLVQLFRELLPSARRVAALANASDPFSKPFLDKIQTAGHETGTLIEVVRVKGPEELAFGFAALEKDRPDAVIVQPSLGFKRAAELALQQGIPAAEHFREFAEAGGLMSYSPVYAELHRRTAALVDKILKGAKPADLPVEQPTKFELVINLKTAKALGLTVPQSLLAGVDEVIE
jgi:putative tryptophan/tyrosine transport system substrate-binding protein